MNEQNTTSTEFKMPAWVPLVAAAVGIIAILFLPLISIFGEGVGFFDLISYGILEDDPFTVIACLAYVVFSALTIARILKRNYDVRIFAIIAGIIGAVLFFFMNPGEELARVIFDRGSGTVIMFIAGIVQAVAGCMIRKN